MYDKINENELFSRLETLSYRSLFSNAFEQSKGSKLLLNGAWIIYFLIAVGVTSIVNILGLDDISTLIALPIILPLNVGVILLALAKVREEEISIPTIFNYYTYVWQLFFAYLLVTLFSTLGFIFFILPGIYIAVMYMFTQVLVVDKNLSFWEAMELSRKVVTKKWFFFFGYTVIITLLSIASLLTLGIGFIWFVPLYTLSYAMLYEYLFSTFNIEEN